MTPGQRAGFYVRHALLHPIHVAILVFAGSAAFVGWIAFGWIGLAMFAALETVGLAVLVLGLFAHVPLLYRSVEETLDRAERAKAAAVRAELLARMSFGHRQELLDLEKLVDGIARVARRQRTPVAPVLDGCSALLAMYVRVAIEQRAARELSVSVDGPALGREVDALAAACACAGPAARALVERRLGIARRRAASWQRALHLAEVLEAQLKTIGERVRLAYEEAAAPERSERAFAAQRVRVEDVSACELLDQEEAAELARQQEEWATAIDPEVLSLGRAHLELP
jgi:hypothetical protein